MTLDELIKQALQETAEEQEAELLNVEKEHKFSLAYRLWEWKFLRDLRKGRSNESWTLRRARRVIKTAVIAGTMALLTLTACVVAPLTIGRFSLNDKRDYSELFLSNISSDKTSITEYYGLPEESGWAIDHIYKGQFDVTVGYVKDGTLVVMEQSVIREYMGNVNTENSVVKPISLYAENDGFLIEFYGGEYGLWWIYDGYLLSLDGNIDKNELINLAYSTKVVNF